MNKNEETVLIDQEEDQIIESKRVEITSETPDVLVCTYGTLRSQPAPGNGNYQAILHNKADYLGTFRSEPRFTMFGRHAGFPIVVDKGTTSIEYEVFRITNPAVLQRCHGLEGCSGIPGDPSNWYDLVPMDTPIGKAWMYVMHGVTRSSDSVIPTGNWNDRNI